MQNNTTKVAIQGDAASFHEIAAMEYYKQPITLIYCQSFGEVFSLLLTGAVDKALVAVSNSNHGEIHEVKALLRTSNVNIEGEHSLLIKQHLIGLPNTNLSEVKRIVSHPVALSQCKDYLMGRFEGAELIEYHDTSAAVAYVKQLSDPSVVAIGSDRAAEVHGLEILERAVQDDVDNATLFQSLKRG
jgi:prephenate dehydratase